ncbi:MAG: GNAT family N-acetyltransferase [Muribaculaceae bacterium]
MKIDWYALPFEELTARQMYDMLGLRAEVFVLEQGEAYLDVDYRDLDCYHVLGYDGDTLVAHCRVFRLGGYFADGCIGRVVVKPNRRGGGLGHDLIEKGIELHDMINGADKSITISAQLRLRNYYEAHGFKKSSTCYSEDNIPHIHMTRTATQNR